MTWRAVTACLGRRPFTIVVAPIVTEVMHRAAGKACAPARAGARRLRPARQVDERPGSHDLLGPPRRYAVPRGDRALGGEERGAGDLEEVHHRDTGWKGHRPDRLLRSRVAGSQCLDVDHDWRP